MSKGEQSGKQRPGLVLGRSSRQENEGGRSYELGRTEGVHGGAEGLEGWPL